MTKEEAIELLRNAVPAKALPGDEIGFFIEAVSMAIEALGKDTNVPSNSALDHIHNVVAENERKRGYEQAKTEYDHKLTEIKSRFKDHYYNKGYSEGYEQGKADANCPEIPDSWIPVTKKMPEEKDAGILKKIGTNKKSDYVIATVEVKGERMTVTACTYDGAWDWNMKYAFPDYKIIAWMPMPEPYKEG